MDQGKATPAAGVVDAVAGLEIVGAVHHRVEAGQELVGVVQRECHRPGVDAQAGVKRLEAPVGAVGLEVSLVRRFVKDLPLKVGE